jgi:hypothetical protein
LILLHEFIHQFQQTKRNGAAAPGSGRCGDFRPGRSPTEAELGMADPAEAIHEGRADLLRRSLQRQRAGRLAPAVGVQRVVLGVFLPQPAAYRPELPAHIAAVMGKAQHVGAVGRLGQQVGIVARCEGVLAESLATFERFALGRANGGAGAPRVALDVPCTELPGSVEQRLLDLLEGLPCRIELQGRTRYRAVAHASVGQLPLRAEAMPVQHQQQGRVGAGQRGQRDRVERQPECRDLGRDARQDVHRDPPCGQGAMQKLADLRTSGISAPGFATAGHADARTALVR